MQTEQGQTFFPEPFLERELTLLKYIRSIASGKLTVICLLLLMVLVIWGTIYQSRYGYYRAQGVFFHSWIIFLGGVIPIPGVALILGVLFLNLVASLFFKIGFHVRKIGNILTHVGILILLLGGGLSFYFAEESVLTLKEGESSGVSISNDTWELAAWQSIGSGSPIYAIDVLHISKRDWTVFQGLNLKIKLKSFYENCEPVGDGPVKSHEDIQGLKRLPLESNPAENRAGVVLSIDDSKGSKGDVFLVAAMPLVWGLNEKTGLLTIELRRKRYPLPFTVTLNDFRKVSYPGTNIPKSFESHVAIQSGEFARPVVISMNRPLRSHQYTFYQSSYFSSRDGSQYSVLSVKKNQGRYFPYIASVLMFLGMVIHFLLMLLNKPVKQK
jgi:hypothetical protein